MYDGVLNNPASAAFIPIDGLPFISATVVPAMDRERVSAILLGSIPFLSSSVCICAITGFWQNNIRQNVNAIRGWIQTGRNFSILIEDPEYSEQDDDIP